MSILRALSMVALLVTTSTAAAGVGDQPIRFRWGAHGGVGFFTPGPSIDINGAIRGGAQLTPDFGTYLEVGGMAGFGISASSDGSSAGISGVIYRYFAPMAEYNYKRLFLAGGPMIAQGGWGYAQANEGETRVLGVSSNFMPGIQGRVGFLRFSPERKRGLTAALDMKMMVGRVRTAEVNGVDVSGADGVPGASLGFAPSIVVGYDGF